MDLVSKSAHGISAEIIIKIRNYLKKIPKKTFHFTLSVLFGVFLALFFSHSHYLEI